MTLVWLPFDSIERARRELPGLPDELEIDLLDAGRLPETGYDRVEFLAFPNYRDLQICQELVGRELPRLRWVQLASAGFEHILDRLPPWSGVCNAPGVHDAGTAELAIGLALRALRGFDGYVLDRQARRFAPVYGDTLADKRVLIFGYGRIGQAVERRLAGFELASLTRVARRARTDPEVHPSADLDRLLPQTDVIFITAPATPDTIGLFDADRLSRLPDQAVLVNVGRGAIVDSDALVAQADRLRLALDVTDPEPLPDDHPLWRVQRLSWTPHIGGYANSYWPRYLRLLSEQLNRLALGQPLAHSVRSPR
ncbi:MAG: dihydrofolate reductase [Propionibacteriaceae bacterium]|jgi:phosphoglycerate dehydrogenase-like enzyme|nr:dihydrofolate reductase [Propionibacteriaceae bacterium]